MVVVRTHTNSQERVTAKDIAINFYSMNKKYVKIRVLKHE
jgi:hypothetical protein